MEVNYNICRLCLLDNAVVNIFEKEKTTVLDMIERTCRLEIFKDEGLPYKVCLTCLSTLQLCDKFILKCIESDEILKKSKICKFIEIEQNHFIKDELENEIKVFDLPHNQDDESDMSYDKNNDDHCSSDEKIKMKDIKKKVKNIKKQNDEKKLKVVARKENKLSTKYIDLNNDVTLIVKKKSDTILCGLCGKSIKRSLMWKHLRIHTTEKNFICDLCDKKYKVRDSLIKHIKGVHGDGVICDLCKNVFSRKSTLKRHIAVVHTMERNHKCDVCDSKFRNKYLLKLHEKTHIPKRPRPHKKKLRAVAVKENKLSVTYNDLNKDVALKVNNRSGTIVCDLCGKSVKRFYLRSHLRIHSLEKNYSCELCNKKFKVRGILMKHIKAIHRDTRVTCNLCNNVYSSSYLKTHMETVHTTEKKYACNICDSKFKREYVLKQHKRIHTQERPYSCKFCDSTFALPRSRVDHERLHMGITPYKCPSCPKSFTQLSNMKSHFKHNHKDIVFSEVYQARRLGCAKVMLNEDLIKPPAIP